MSAFVKKVSPEDWAVIQRLVAQGGFNSGVVLIPESVMAGLPEDIQEEIELMDGYADGYDFGGEADIFVDVVLSPEHQFVRFAEREEA